MPRNSKRVEIEHISSVGNYFIKTLISFFLMISINTNSDYNNL